MEIMFFFLHSPSISQYFEVMTFINLNLKYKVTQWKTELAPWLSKPTGGQPASKQQPKLLTYCYFPITLWQDIQFHFLKFWSLLVSGLVKLKYNVPNTGYN